VINIDNLILYLRTNIVGYRVAGAASLAAAADDSRVYQGPNKTIIPTLFVTLGKLNASLVASQTFLQEYVEKIEILVVLDNQVDRTGQSAQAQIYQLRKNLYALLLNFRADIDCTSLHAVWDGMASMNRALYWHQFEFQDLGRLDGPDGVPDDWGNLNEITVAYNDPVDPNADNPLAQDDYTNLNPP
jgi:hypothetical protein